MITGGCLPLICSPTSPGHPFGSWYLAIADITRLLCIFGAFTLVAKIGVAWRRSMPHQGQRDRYLALGLLAMVITGTELENIGNYPSYRLILSLIALAFALRGLIRSQSERPATQVGTDPV